ncbi:electron transfer flavoprotein alpha subunit apoprotein [Scopulibacillus darangshiensis]|uniref:Electron transfer flavoprotein alpha subunit apoprotein n=1 Tax=Scopulibacillus darangshiensis TaxID=442528 RepID=A0A4R2NVJ8_9BACL|nr:electron transfer flavoprotein subunit alpha/FixB family protein [Scopulibacillus darangshiensis]TCP25608.1 electron transfer flavoprotein alpha subunit apoprotein [Scopulibacillus darangshiensis]
MGKRVFVLAETKDGKLRHVSYEALTVARQVAQGGEVNCVLFGPSSVDFTDEISKYGANKLYIVNDNRVDIYTTDAYVQTVSQLVNEIEPDVILMGHTAIGKDLAPRLAARLKFGLISDCTEVVPDGDNIVFSRPIYAGKAFQKRRFRKGLVFATLRPNNFEALEKPTKTEVVLFEPTIKDLRTIVKEIVKKTAGGGDLSEAKIIVSGGRGVKSTEGFKPLQELADVLGGAVAASRGACDAEFCDYSLQIGQTGKVVTPDLYIACGISGAIQHLAGMSNSKVIVAINKDPEAPIFEIADYGIVGDLFEVVPLLTKDFKKTLTVNA